MENHFKDSNSALQSFESIFTLTGLTHFILDKTLLFKLCMLFQAKTKYCLVIYRAINYSPCILENSSALCTFENLIFVLYDINVVNYRNLKHSATNEHPFLKWYTCIILHVPTNEDTHA